MYIKTIYDTLNEMSQAGYGNWKPTKSMISTRGATGFRVNWNHIKDIKIDNDNIGLYQLDNEFIAGIFINTDEEDEEVFEVNFHIKLSERKDVKSLFKLNQKVYNVDRVEVAINKRSLGIATKIYKILVNDFNYIILGDELQFFGARRLWTRLSKSLDVVVDIIDIDKNVVIEKDAKLKHGSKDWEFDKRVWSREIDKNDIRLLLTKIK